MLRSIILRLLINAGAIYAAAYLLDGVLLKGFKGALFVAVVFGILNTLIRPLLLLLTLPINILTLGLFTLVINAVILGLTDEMSQSINIIDFGTTFMAALIISVINAIVGMWENE